MKYHKMIRCRENNCNFNGWVEVEKPQSIVKCPNCKKGYHVCGKIEHLPVEDTQTFLTDGEMLMLYSDWHIYKPGLLF